MRLLRKPWTAEDDERLRSMVSEGASANRVSVAFKRSVDTVQDRARKIGCPFPSVRQARRAGSAQAANSGHPAVRQEDRASRRGQTLAARRDRISDEVGRRKSPPSLF